MFIYQAVQPPAPVSYQLAPVSTGADSSSEDGSRWGTWQPARKVAKMAAHAYPDIHVMQQPSVLGRQVVIQSQATESAIREIARALGYRLQVQGNPSTVSLSSILLPGITTARKALFAIGSLSTVDITVNEPLRLLQVRIFSSATADTINNSGPVVTTPPSRVSVPHLTGAQPTAGLRPHESATGGLPAALKRKMMLQRGDLQSVLRQIAAITGYQVSIHPSAPMGVIGDGLPWGKPAAAAVILHKLGKQSYLDVQVLTQARHIIVTVKL
ncbi:MAG: hypothetical protein ACYCUY_06095 [Acidithiobacillus sp.]